MPRASSASLLLLLIALAMAALAARAFTMPLRPAVAGVAAPAVVRGSTAWTRRMGTVAMVNVAGGGVG